MDPEAELRFHTRFKEVWMVMYEQAPLFRFTMACIIVLLGTGLNIHIFKKYDVNYLHIFGLDYRY
jgi:hypothetical protein